MYEETNNTVIKSYHSFVENDKGKKFLGLGLESKSILNGGVGFKKTTMSKEYLEYLAKARSVKCIGPLCLSTWKKKSLDTPLGV